MEIVGFEVPLWGVLLFGAAMGLYYFSKRNHDYFDKMMVPYPKPWPFVGNIVGFIRNPLDELFLGYVNKYGKIFGLFTGSSPALSVADPEFVKEVMVKEFSKFSDRRPTGFQTGVFQRMLTSLSADHWKHVRNQLSGAFTSGKLKLMLSLIDKNVDGLTQNLAEKSGEEIVIKDFTGAYTLDAIASTAFGLVVDSQKDPEAPILKHAKAFFNFSFGNPLLLIILLVPKLGKVLASMGIEAFPKSTTDYFLNMLRQTAKGREAETVERKDFLSIALQRKVDMTSVSPDSIRQTKGLAWSTEGLSEEEIMSNALIFFLAGFETTATLIQYALYSLVQNPEVLDRLRAEVLEHAGGSERAATYEELGKMEYLEWTMSETLRMYPPAMLTDRDCLEDVTIRGIRIPKGCAVNILIYNIHHDPEYWPEPKVFNPERFDPANKPENFPYIYLPFGVGPRNCIGMRLALLEAKAALARIVQKFDIEKTATTPPAPPKFKAGAGFLTTKDPITLKLTVRAK